MTRPIPLMFRPMSLKGSTTLSLCLTLALVGCQSVADTNAQPSAPTQSATSTASSTANGAPDAQSQNAQTLNTQTQGEAGSVSDGASNSADNSANSRADNSANSRADNNANDSASTGGDASSDATPPYSGSDAAGFNTWIREFRQRAAGEGIDAATLEEAFGRASFQPRILELDSSQPEFSRQVWDYLDSAVSDQRVATGRERLSTHRDLLDDVTRDYGVPGEIVVAIWGIESNYGSNFGDFETIDALSTLGYDGRRQSFARQELMAALKILQNGDIDRDRMRGSWAGAMGHTQFIPSSFLAYAVDEDGDGRRDIWGSIPDVMGSTANYLARSGWQRNQPWGIEVSLPADFDYSQTGMETRRDSDVWRSQGVRRADGDTLPAFDQASILAPAGAEGPAFLAGPNFRVIMRYNASTSYALAVATLSDRIDGRPGVQGQWPRSEPALARSQIRRMQGALNAQGFNVGTPDGLVGPNTREGLRDYQRSIGTTPDGYPTQSLIRQITGE